MVTNGLQTNHLLPFLQYSNIHIPVIAVGLIGSTSIVLNIEFSLPLAISSGAGAFVIYQIDRIWLPSPEDDVNQPERVEWYRKNYSYAYLSSGIAFISGIIAVLFLKLITVGIGLLLAMVGFIYLIPYGSSFSRLKGNLWAKPLFITLCWAYGGVVLPVIESGHNINGMAWCFFLYRSLLIAANVLLSDLPDQKGDGESKLVTLAIILTKNRLIQLVMALSLFSLIVGGIQGFVFNWPAVLYIDLIGAILMLLLSYRALNSEVASSHFAYGYVNDLIIAWPLVSVVTYYLFEGIG